MEKKINNRLKIVLLLVSTLTVMAGATIAPSLPQMAEVFKDLPSATFLSKLILTLPALAIALCAPLAGWLVDKLGRLKVLIPSLVLYALAGSVGFFVQDLYVILVGRLFLGIGVAGIMTTAITLIGDYFEGDQRAKFIGIQAAFMSLGGAIFVSAGGFLADIDWSYPFLIYLFSLPVLIGVYLYLFEPKAMGDQTIAATSNDSNDWKSVVPVLGIALFSMIAFYMIPVQLPFLLQEMGITKNSLAGMAIAISTLASTITGLAYGKIRQRTSIEIIFLILFTLMAVGYFIISASTLFSHIMIAMVITGFGLGMLMPNLNTWLLELAGVANRGKYTGWLSSALFLGQFTSPLIIAPLGQYLDLASVFMLVAFLLLVSAIFFLIIHFLKKKPNISTELSK